MNIFSLFHKRVRHPFFTKVAAEPASSARGPATALAGTFGELEHARARGAEARRTVYVLRKEGEPLGDRERDRLWRLYGVPVYALAKRGDSVVAWECEAQDGLHFAGDGDAACTCGRPGPKVRVVGTGTRNDT
jgi:hypothetical protein